MKRSCMFTLEEPFSFFTQVSAVTILFGVGEAAFLPPIAAGRCSSHRRGRPTRCLTDKRLEPGPHTTRPHSMVATHVHPLCQPPYDRGPSKFASTHPIKYIHHLPTYCTGLSARGSAVYISAQAPLRTPEFLEPLVSCDPESGVRR